MTIRGKMHRCLLMVSVVGLYHTMTSVTTASLAAFIVAITTKNLSPLWAARRLLAGTEDGVIVRIDWAFPDSEAEVGAKLCKVGGEIRLEGGGLAYEDSNGNEPLGAMGDISGAVGCSVLTMVGYSPKRVLSWIAEASEGPECVGETEPAKPVPESPGEGHRSNGAPEFGESSQTKINLWS